MADTGWLLPNVSGTHAGHSSIGLGTKSWYATPYIKAVDGQSAYIQGSAGGSLLANQELTEWLRAEDFRPTIPSGAILTGMSVRYFVRRTGAAQLAAVCLRQGGAYFAGSIKRPNSAIGSSYAILEYGGVFDQWAVALTRAMVTDPTFGVVMQARATAANSNVLVDYVQVKYHYTVSEDIIPTPAKAEATATLGNAIARSITVTMPSARASAKASLSAAIQRSIVVATSDASASATAGLADVNIGTNFRWFPDPARASATAEIADVISGSVTISMSPARASASSVPPSMFFSSTTVPMPSARALATAKFGRLIVKIPIAMPSARASATATIKDTRVTWAQLRLYADFLRNSQQSVVLAWPCLVTITHPDLAQPERLTNAGIPLESRGNLYDAIPFDVRFPTGGRNQISEGAITLPLQSRRVRGTYRALPEPRPRVTVDMVSGDDPDTVVETRSNMRMVSDQTGGGVMTIVIDDGDFERQQFPPLRFDGRWAAVHD